MSFLKEDSSLTQEQRIAACFSKWGSSKKLAGCYEDYDQCLKDQTSKGKSKEMAENICNFFSNAKENKDATLLSDNLIMLNPEMNTSLLPENQIIFYNSLLDKWIDKKESSDIFLTDFSVDDIKTMKDNIVHEIENRNINPSRKKEENND